MAKFFNDKGISACAVISDGKSELSLDRKEAISRLKKEDIKIIFSVDMFNEGIDIPSLDLVMLLRPTESPTIFLQQLGRGLRKSKDKKYLNVLDFIGNFKKANMIPFLLTGRESNSKSKGKSVRNIKEEDYPEDCIVDFDFRLVDLFEKMEREKQKIEDIITDEYFRIKDYLGYRPSRVDIFTYMDEDLYMNMKRNSKLNILNDYLGYLSKQSELKNQEEQEIVNNIAHDFIKMIENTKMSQLYKMPLLLAFYNKGDIKLKINDDDIYKSFKAFYSEGSNAVDLSRNKSTNKFKEFDKKDYLRIAKNPKDAFLKTHGKFFYKTNDSYALNEELLPFIKKESFKNYMKDSIDYRTKRFYKERLEKKNEELQ